MKADAQRHAAGAGAGPERHRARLATVAFVRNGDDVLLGRHPAASDRFAGRWNGIGGHVEPGEGVAQAARRELFEETGLVVDRLRLRGVIHESGLLGQAYVLFVFAGETPTRELRSDEGRELRWQPIPRLSELRLVADVADLLPRALSPGEPFFATERYDGNDARLSIRFDEEGEPPGPVDGGLAGREAGARV
ncbi:MAG: NUDIX domain-containing protein [Myxococcota bacterium]